MSNSTLHPPKSGDEIFVGNQNGTELPNHLSSLKTARLVSPAYDLYGEEIPHMRALFIGKSEELVYDRIMMDRFRAALRGH